MFYTPNFCAECGEKIDRAERYLWTSSRFCEECSDTFKTARFLPKIVGVIITMCGGILVGSQIASKPNVENVNVSSMSPTYVSPQKAESTKQNLATNVVPISNSKAPMNVASAKPQVIENAQAEAKVARPNQLSANSGIAEVTEALYFCGAITKKGTYCSRKVKTAGRCWQHVGQPAGLQQEKLRIQ